MKYAIVLVALTSAASAQPSEPPVESQPQPELQPPAQPQPQQPAPTRATFVSTGEARWDVWVDQQPACATPCTIGVMPLQFVALRTQERNPIRVDVGYLPQGDLMVSAKPLSNGMYATGIVFTSLSGMALATGITLTAIGCATDRDGMCTAGLITGGVGAVGLVGSIYLMNKALPRASVGPATPYVAGNQVGLAGQF